MVHIKKKKKLKKKQNPNTQCYMGEECHQCHRKSGGNLVYVSHACKIEYTERQCDGKRCLLHI